MSSPHSSITPTPKERTARITLPPVKTSFPKEELRTSRSVNEKPIETVKLNEITGKPIQLVLQNEKGEILLNEGAMSLIRSIKGYIGVFAIVGPSRHGKSYLLNRLLNRSNGFQVGHFDQPCTKGIWMWNNIIQVKNEKDEFVNCLLLDTEGIETDGTSEWESKLFVLSYLLSSMFCYNTRNILTTDAIKRLSIIQTITERIKLNENEKLDPIEEERIKDECPDFLWVIRDTVQSSIIPQERLRRFITDESSESEANPQRLKVINKTNIVRTKIRGLFRSHACYYLPCPVTDGTDGRSFEDALLSIDMLNWEKLRDTFKSEMTYLRNNVFNKISVKKVNSQKLTGMLFTEYLKNMVIKLNTTKKVNTIEILRASMRFLAEVKLNDVKKEYADKLGDLKQPLSLEKFNEAEEKIYSYCLKNLKDYCFDNKNMSDEFEKKLEFFRKEENGICQMFRNKNSKAAYVYNYNLAKSLWEKRMESKIAQFSSSREFRVSLNELRKEFEMKAVKGGDEYHNAWSRWVETTLINHIEKNVKTQKHQQIRIREMEMSRKELERKQNEEVNKNKKLLKEIQKLKEENIKTQEQLKLLSSPSIIQETIETIKTSS